MHDTLVEDIRMHIDGITDKEEGVNIDGWCFSTSSPIKKVRIRKDNEAFEANYGKERKDVRAFYQVDVLIEKNGKEEVISRIENAFDKTGFSISVPQKFENKKDIFIEILKENEDEWVKIKVFDDRESSPLIKKTNVLKISKNRKPEIIIVDNIYENPDEVREFALSCEFKTNDSYHKGARTVSRYLPEGMKEVFEKYLNKKITKWEDHGTNGVFQYCIAQDALVYHVDMQSYAAMIYLTPDAAPSCGTTCYKSKRTGLRKSPTEKDAKALGKNTSTLYSEIFRGNFYDKTDLDVVDVAGNVYNRLVIFDSKSIHSSSGYFGDKKENARLFQIFFFDVE